MSGYMTDADELDSPLGDLEYAAAVAEEEERQAAYNEYLADMSALKSEEPYDDDDYDDSDLIQFDINVPRGRSVRVVLEIMG